MHEPNRCAKPGETCTNNRDVGLCRVGIPRGGCGWVRGWYLDGLRLDGLHLDGRDLRVDVNACAGRTICLHQNQIVGDCRGRFGPATDCCRHAAARTNEPSVVPPSANGALRGVVTSAKGESLLGATGQLVDTQIGTAPRSDGHYRTEEISTGTYDLRVRLVGCETITSPITAECGAEPTCGPATLPPRAIALEGAVVPAQKWAQALEDVPVALSSVDGQRARLGWRTLPQVARARRRSRPLRLLRGVPRKVAPKGSPSRTSRSGGLTSNGSFCPFLSANAPVFSPSRRRPHRCRRHYCRCRYCG